MGHLRHGKRRLEIWSGGLSPGVCGGVDEVRPWAWARAGVLHIDVWGHDLREALERGRAFRGGPSMA